MPHLLVERIRSPVLVTRKEYPSLAFVIEVLDVIAGIIFVISSVCFLPHFAHTLNTFLAGCAGYIAGSFLYLLLSAFAQAEAYIEKGWTSMEFCENSLYFIGSWTFFVGTVLYWPSEAHHKIMEKLQGCTVAQYLNIFSPEFEGTLLFIAGSMMFAMAAFTNALNQRKFDDRTSTMLTITTSLYMLGSLLFVGGSVAFLPDLGCNEQMLNIGACSFIIGSLFYLVGAVVSLLRTMDMMGSGDREGLMAKSVDAP